MSKKRISTPVLPKKVLVDTCFLSCLVKEDHKFHGNAKQYFEELLSAKSVLFLSAIVWAEFSERQKVFDIFENFQFRPFGFFEVEKLHSLVPDQKFFKTFDSGLRVSIKDDAKILSHYFSEELDAIITADKDLISFAEGKGVKVLDFKIPISSYLGELEYENFTLSC